MSYQHILVSVFQLAVKGELTKIEQKNIVQALVSYGNSIEPQELEEKFKQIRTGTKNLIEQIDSCVDSAYEIVKNYNKIIEDVSLQTRNLPEGAVFGDDKETLEFIKSLKDDNYNFSQAEKLIGISRQTIKKHADTSKYGLKTVTFGKSPYITRKALIDYYRAYFDKYGYNF